MKKLLFILTVGFMLFGCKTNDDKEEENEDVTAVRIYDKDEISLSNNAEDSDFSEYTTNSYYVRNSGSTGIIGTWKCIIKETPIPNYTYIAVDETFIFNDDGTYSYSETRDNPVQDGSYIRTTKSNGEFTICKNGNEYILETADGKKNDTIYQYSYIVSDKYLRLGKSTKKKI